MATQTKKITLDTTALFLGRIAGLALSVVRLSYLALYLGVANFGILNFAVYFTSLFQFLFDLGLAQLLTRELARDPSRSNILLGTTLVLKAFVALVASIFVTIAMVLSQFDPVTSWAVGLTTIALAVNGIATLFLSAFQAHRKMILVSGASIVNDMILSGAVIILVPLYPDLTTVLILTVLASFVNLGFLGTAYTRVIGRPVIRVERDTWRLLLREGAPIALSSLGISTYTFMGPTILKYARGEVEVGIFSAGYKIISILTLLPMVLTQILLPIFSDFAERTRHKLHKALEDSLRVMLLVSLPLAVGTIMVAPELIHFLYPSAYQDASFVLRMVIAGNAVGYLAWILYTFLIASGRQTFCMWNSLVIGVLVLGANLLLVPLYGYRGVAVILMCTDICLFLSLFFYVNRIGYSLRETRTAWKIFLSSLAMGAILYAFQSLSLFILIALGVIVYALLIIILRALGDQEREIIAKLMQRW